MSSHDSLKKDERHRIRESLRTVWHGLRSTRVSSSASFSDGGLVSGSPATRVDTTAGIIEDPGSSAWIGLMGALCVLERGASAFPPLKSAFSGVVDCLDIVRVALETQNDYEELAGSLKASAENVNQYIGEIGPEAKGGSIARIARSIEDEAAGILKLQNHKKTRRILDMCQDQDVVIKHYRRIEVLFRQLQNDINLRSWKTVDKQYKMSLLERLPLADDARYDSSYSTIIKRHGCTAQTREKVQVDIQSWIQCPSGANVYWMNGMAGTGKTTIAYSVCEWLEESKLLGASFFCSRASPSCRNVNKIVPAIAVQLAQYSPAFRSALCNVIEGNPTVGTLNVVRQFEKLIRDPLLETKGAMPDSVTIVIDVLDECEDTYGVRLVLETLLRLATDLPLKFFLTSRPEPAIRDSVLGPGRYRPSVLHLHDIEESLVENDIKKYLIEALSAMSPVPSEDQVEKLTKKSGKLFIYAATVVRYILPEKGPADSRARLHTILAENSQPKIKEGAARRYKRLDELYENILTVAFDEGLENEEVEAMSLVLRTVVCAKETMTIRTLASWLGMDEERVSLALGPLQSVLYVTGADGPVSTLHASFPDYMLDQTRSGRYYCDQAQHNELMAQRCFEVMEKQLKFNICNLESSFDFDREVQGLRQRVQRTISPVLFYVCRYWGDHLRISNASIMLREMLEDFLFRRLLFWMEVLNLARLIGVSAPILTQAQSWLLMNKIGGYTITHIADARSFATMFAASACSLSTCHLYLSALVCCPRESSVYRLYGNCIQGGMTIEGGIMERREQAALATWRMSSEVAVAAISPDGTFIAAGLDDGTIWVNDSYTGEVIAGPFRGHTWVVHSVAISPDSTLVVSGSMDHTIRVWDAHTGNLVVGPMKGHIDSVYSVAFSPDGARIVSGSMDRTIRVWDVRTGKVVVGPFEGHTNQIHAVAFSPDGTRIASGSKDETVRVWDAHTGILAIEPLQGHGDQIHSVAFSPDGTHVVSGSINGSIQVWDIRTGNSVGDLFERHKDTVYSVAFSPDGNLIASGSADKAIRIWGARTGNLVGLFEGHSDVVNSVAFSLDGTRVVSSSDDMTIRVWDARPHVIAGTLQQGTRIINSVTFSPDGSQVVTGSNDKLIKIWDPYTGDLVAGPFRGHTSSVSSVTFSPDGSRIGSGSLDWTIRVWDSHTGSPAVGPIKGHTAPVNSVAFSPDGARICSGSSDTTARIWDAYTGDLVAWFEGHTDSVTSVVFSPDGARVASGSSDRTIQIWDAYTGVVATRPIEGHTDSVSSVAFSPIGDRVVSGSSDRAIKVWDARTGDLLVDSFEGHTDAVTSVVFSSDGARIVSGSRDCTIRVWDAHLGRQIGTPFKRVNVVRSIALCPDGTHIVADAIGVSSIQMWDMNTGRLVAGRPQEYELPVDSIELGSGGTLGRLANEPGDYIAEAVSETTGATVGETVGEAINAVEQEDLLGRQSGVNLSGIPETIFSSWDSLEDTSDISIITRYNASFSRPGRRVVVRFCDKETRWIFRDDGWVMDGNNPLFWVPPDLHDFVPHTPTQVMRDPRGSFTFDCSNLGENWTKCFVERYIK